MRWWHKKPAMRKVFFVINLNKPLKKQSLYRQFETCIDAHVMYCNTFHDCWGYTAILWVMCASRFLLISCDYIIRKIQSSISLVLREGHKCRKRFLVKIMMGASIVSLGGQVNYTPIQYYDLYNISKSKIVNQNDDIDDFTQLILGVFSYFVT